MNGALSPSVNNPRLGLIGNPENRRIRDFQAAVVALGLPAPPCLAYEELLDNPDALAAFDVDLLRIDSPGENERVARSFITRGGGQTGADFDPTEIALMREHYRGFCEVLDQIERRGLPCLNPPADIRVMFDKWACHLRFTEQGVARPSAWLAAPNLPSFLRQLRQQPGTSVFLKPLHGSSASGVCALRWTSQRQQLIAPLRIRSRAGQPVLVNSLAVRTYTTRADIELILTLLLPQGMICEEWIPKLTLPEGALDLRVLVIAGQPRHWVARQSRQPFTNLHLGNRRADESAVRDLLGADGLAHAFAIAQSAAACFPASLYAGVDILIDSRHRAYVGEINAFGDLLPGLLHHGESAYAALAQACHAARCLV